MCVPQVKRQLDQAYFFFFKHPPPPEISPLPLPAPLPIPIPLMARISSPAPSPALAEGDPSIACRMITRPGTMLTMVPNPLDSLFSICCNCWNWSGSKKIRSEEHTSELQSQSNLVCRLLLE